MNGLLEWAVSHKLTEWAHVYREGLCQNYPNLPWVPEQISVKSAAECAVICEGCPVKADCLTMAIENHELFGIFGGLTPAQRRAEAKRRRAA